MASAWGYSFGKAFGNSFGAISKDNELHGGKRKRAQSEHQRTHSEHEIRHLVDAKWEAIAEQGLPSESTPKVALDTKPIEQTAAQPNLQPNSTQNDSQTAGNQPNPALDSIFNRQAAKPAQIDAAAAPLLPSAADKARKAKQRNDEEALMLILANL